MVQIGAFRDGPARLSPVFVGREPQLALALRRWSAAREGVGHFLLVAGEAGIGKSRLIAEFSDRLDGGDRAFTAAAFPRESETVGGVLLNLADDLGRAGETAAADELRTRLLTENSTVGDPVHRRRLLVGDLADIIGRLLRAAPAVLRVEDLHWADELSLDVFDRLPEILRVTPGLVVATYRSDELYPQTALRQWRARMLEQRRAEEMRLPRLDLSELAAMSEGMTGNMAPATWLESLHRRSDGIPLHVEELIAGGTADFVPDTVSEAVLARVGALAPVTRSVTDAASVIGRSFDLDLLGTITGESPDEIDLAMRELADHHLVLARGDGSTFDFRHMLIRDAIYDDIAPNRRRRLHAAVAVAAEHSGFRDAYVSDHFERAHRPVDSYAHALAAADEARAVSSHREAAELYARAIRTEPANTSDETRARTRVTYGLELAAIDDNQGSLDQWNSALELYRRIGDHEKVASLAANLMAARHLLGADLAERIALGRQGLAELDALPNGGDRLIRAEVLGAISAAYMLDRRLEEAIESGEQAQALALGPNGNCERLNVDFTLGSVLVFAGRMEEGWSILENAILSGRGDLYEAETSRGFRMLGSSASVLVDYDRAERWIGEGLAYSSAVERWNDHYYLLAHLAHVYWATGRWDVAAAAASRALADGQGITTRITALIALGYTYLGSGELEHARAALTEARELGERMRELQRLSPSLWGLAELALAEKDAAGAVDLTELALNLSASVRDAAYAFPFVVTGTRARLAGHDLGGARDWLARCDDLLRFRNIPGTLTALDHAAGLIFLAEGQTGKARAALERAREGWTASGRFWEGTAVLLDLALSAVRSRRPADALSLISTARSAADAAGATALIAAADSIHIDTDAIIGDGLLSAREFEVARLVASGATNKEIALDLVISPKTVSAHVEHILAKLGASRRAEIAAWVARMP